MKVLISDIMRGGVQNSVDTPRGGDVEVAVEQESVLPTSISTRIVQ